MWYRILLLVLLAITKQCWTKTCATEKRWGFICLDEYTTAICISNGTDFIQISQNDCDEGLYCNEEYRNCSANPSITSNYAEYFLCSSQGLYPDLMNCGKYLYCPGIYQSAISMSCPDGYMFSTYTSCCSEYRTSDKCSRRRELCANETEIGAWAENKNYFYFCMQIYPYQVWVPQLVKCPENQFFDGIQCATSDIIAIQPTVSMTLKSGSTTLSSVSSSGCVAGSFNTDFLDCRKYWYCGLNGTWTSYSCGPYAKFDLATKKCRIGDC